MKISIVLFIAIMSQTLFSQEKGLVIEYKKTTDIIYGENHKLNSSEFAKYRDVIKNIQANRKKTTYYELQIKNNESVYKQLEQIDNDLNLGNSNMRIHMKRNEGITYKNESEVLRTVEFPKDYIVVDTLKKYEWKLTRESKNICGFDTKKATFLQVEDSIQIEAWFAGKINNSFGPQNYHGLPGLILELKLEIEKKDEKITEIYSCNKIEEKKVKIIKPTKGEMISPEQLKAIYKERAEKQKEMFKNEEGVIIVK